MGGINSSKSSVWWRMVPWGVMQSAFRARALWGINWTAQAQPLSGRWITWLRRHDGATFSHYLKLLTHVSSGCSYRRISWNLIFEIETSLLNREARRPWRGESLPLTVCHFGKLQHWWAEIAGTCPATLSGTPFQLQTGSVFVFPSPPWHCRYWLVQMSLAQ